MNGRRVELGSDKERVLLCLLALDVGRPVALGMLVDRLWDGEPPPHARESAHSYVSRLRRRLRLVDPSSANAPHIVSRAHTYTLESACESVDWHQFQQLVTRSGTFAAHGDDDRTATLLERAERLWQGEALAGLPGLWAETMRRTLTERRLSATVSRIAAHLRLGRFAEVIADLSGLVDRYPGDETLAGQLMVAYYGNNRYTDALRVHQEARRLLMSQYGSRPGAELNRIHRGILDRVPAADLVRGTTTAPRSTAPAAPPPPPPSPPPPRNLPNQPPLVGRRTEMRALSAAGGAATQSTSVISVGCVSTISGMAGIGKTAVAVHGAHRLTERFPDAQLYLDLRGHSSVGEPLTPGAALATLLRLLGAPANTIPVELEGRTALWQTMLAPRRAVIVLDDAASTDQIRPLLPSGSSSLTIITSRRHLPGLPHARHIPLDVLPTDDAIALFRSFVGEERTQDIQQTALVVRLCGHLPLALELVAGRFHAHPAWTLTTLANRLTRDEGRLAEIRDAELEMVRALDLTYQTLTDEQRAAFRRLSLHPGPDFAMASAAVSLDLSPSATERMLETLLASSVLREPTADRYQFHDLLREYGRSRSLTDDTDQDRSDVLKRLTDFYIDAADRADRVAYPRRTRPAPPPDHIQPRLPHLPDAEAARSWLAAERANLLAAEQYARSQADAAGAARLAYAVAGFLDEECHWHDAWTVLQNAVAHWTQTGEQAALCRALILLGAVHAHTGRYQEATGCGNQALRITHATGDTEAEAEALRTLGTLHWHLGDHRAALVLFQKSFAITAISGDSLDRARLHNNMAVTLLFLGELDRALEHFQKSLSGFTEAGDHAALGRTFNNIGDLHMRRGDLESAQRSFVESLTFLERSGNRYDRATVRGSLADALTELGETDSALELYQETLTEFRSLGDRKSQADTLIGTGEAYRKAGNIEKAQRNLADALDIARLIGAAHQEIQALRRIGQTHLSTDQLDSAREHLEAALSLAERTGDADEITKTEKALTEVKLMAGHTAETEATPRQTFDTPDSN
ncbi:AfsR/SARP family transcriptional regulator [Streptomyces fuscichromogenes]|uniref:AfsR/SARP family transcriptional regulator n=1 Tax=Streptomyces fuscichromogenes TaxID=1324013 RepID=UPI00381DCFA4